MSDSFPPDAATAAVIVAAGRGQRAGSGEGPKQYRPLADRSVLARTLDAFLALPEIGPIVVVIHAEDHGALRAACPDLPPAVLVTEGGETRQDSVRLGLEALREAAPARVLIHDAARPFANAALIRRVIAAIDEAAGALPALPVADTLKREAADGTVFETVSRVGLHAAQTPQGFPFEPIVAAHTRAKAEGRTDFTDDASVAEWAGLAVRLVEGTAENVKLTYRRDIEQAEQRLLREGAAFPDVRTGNGYDVHGFEPGDHVVLCGVAIPHDRKLSGHSDADVALHAITDALLATCGAGDIGTHFPPSDPQWQGAASRVFVEHAARLVRERGGRVANIDVTIVAEAPRVGPHRPAMTAALGEMLGIGADRVSVKATTNERLGFIGRAEGIAAIATASVVYPGRLDP